MEALNARKPCPRQLHLKPAQGAAGPAVTLSLHEGTEPATARGERPCPGSPSPRPVSGQGSPLQRDAADGGMLLLPGRSRFTSVRHGADGTSDKPTLGTAYGCGVGGCALLIPCAPEAAQPELLWHGAAPGALRAADSPAPCPLPDSSGAPGSPAPRGGGAEPWGCGAAGRWIRNGPGRAGTCASVLSQL